MCCDIQNCGQQLACELNIAYNNGILQYGNENIIIIE